jgi:hypothetical protein
MAPNDNIEKVRSSLEGSLREPGPSRLADAGRAPVRGAAARRADASKGTTESPMVLYGRLGYIRRDRVEGAVHHSEPSEG